MVKGSDVNIIVRRRNVRNVEVHLSVNIIVRRRNVRNVEVHLSVNIIVRGPCVRNVDILLRNVSMGVRNQFARIVMDLRFVNIIV
jgi:hypothetical protein